MIDKNMIALAEIRNGYTLPKYGNLTLEQNSLIKYDNLCLKLIEENQELKANWDKLKEWLENNWIESQDIWFVKIINKMQELEGSDKE